MPSVHAAILIHVQTSEDIDTHRQMHSANEYHVILVSYSLSILPLMAFKQNQFTLDVLFLKAVYFYQHYLVFAVAIQVY